MFSTQHPRFTGDHVSIGSDARNRDALIDMESVNDSNADSNSVSNVQVSTNVSTNGDLQDLADKKELRLEEVQAHMQVVKEIPEEIQSEVMIPSKQEEKLPELKKGAVVSIQEAAT